MERLPSLLFFRAGQADAPIELADALTADQMVDAVLKHSSQTLRRPVDVGKLGQVLDLLPRFYDETQLLLQENEQLRAEVARLQGLLTEQAEGRPSR